MADDLTRAFQIAVVPRAGFLDRLRGRVPRAAAFVEIRNILATTAFDQGRESEIADVLAKAKLLPRDATSDLSAIFEDGALALTVDRELSDTDHHALDVLKRAFELTDAEADAAIERAVSTVYERALRTAIAGQFTAADKVRLEQMAVAKRINYSGPTASIKIVKGLRWRMGSIAVQRVTQDVMTEIDRVDVYITSKRVFLNGARKNTSIPLTKVVYFTVYSDGLQIEKESGKDVYLVGSGDWEIAGACLDAAARNIRSQR